MPAISVRDASPNGPDKPDSPGPVAAPAPAALVEARPEPRPDFRTDPVERSLHQAVEQVFLSPRVIDQRAFDEFLVARLEGKSSLGRLGLLIHSTAGFVDAGFSGHITLELSNVANLPITLYPGMKIGQVSFLQMTTPADVPYGSAKVGSKYQGQRGPTPSRYFENFK